MSCALYMDEHVSRAITLGLRRRGVDVLTVQEDGRAGISDRDLLDRATELGRVLFSQDDDLLVEATERQKTNVSFSGVVYGHQLKLTIGEVVGDLELVVEGLWIRRFSIQAHDDIALLKATECAPRVDARPRSDSEQQNGLDVERLVALKRSGKSVATPRRANLTDGFSTTQVIQGGRCASAALAPFAGAKRRTPCG